MPGFLMNLCQESRRMRLCDTDIERHLDEGKIVIEPRPGVERISGVSVDVLLGNEFRVFRDHTAPYIDLGGTSAEMADAIERVMSEEIHVPDGEAFYLLRVSWRWR